MHDGKQSLFSIVDKEGGWTVTKNVSLPKPLVADIDKAFASAQTENLINSIEGLLYELSAQPLDLQGTSLRHESHYWVVRTNRENTTCDYYFSDSTLICEKLVKQGAKFQLTVFYTDYRAENGILLPHKLEMKLPDGKSFGNHVIAKWELGKVWPENFFTAAGVAEF
jgi:hypothetical protein